MELDACVCPRYITIGKGTRNGCLYVTFFYARRKMLVTDAAVIHSICERNVLTTTCYHTPTSDDCYRK
jgi:hypothetical protein